MTKKKSAPYYHVTNGEWIVVPKRGLKDQCCDCGLVHVVNFRMNKKGELEVQATRDERATAAVRRAFKFERD